MSKIYFKQPRAATPELCLKHTMMHWAVKFTYFCGSTIVWAAWAATQLIVFLAACFLIAAMVHFFSKIDTLHVAPSYHGSRSTVEVNHVR